MKDCVRNCGFILLFCLTGFVLSCCYRCQITDIQHQVNPLQFGLEAAITDEERYYILQKTHQEAKRLGVGVSYSGINEISIDIPADAKSIPLTNNTDFAGVKLQVRNVQKNFFLFSLSDKLNPIDLEGSQIDGRDFSDHSLLKYGRKMLIVIDKTPWVEKRIGYNYGATRKDVLLVENGKSLNGPIHSYSTPSSSPECYYCEVGTRKKVFDDIRFCRTDDSSKKTYLLKVENQCDISISNVEITTSDSSGLFGDKAIYIANCANVSLENITINGTYSLTNKFGYGVSLENVYNVHVNKMCANANWGVFGDNNVQKAVLTNCEINRFDIHCYGKDISFEDCNFLYLYNQFSSIYGELRFRNCTFTGFSPILMEYSYNAYTAFDVVFEDCTFNMDKKHNSIVYYPKFNKTENSRPELVQKCLPNVTMQDCRVNIGEGQKKWYIYNIMNANGYESDFYYISKVILKRLSSNSELTKMTVFNGNVSTNNEVQIIVD